MGIPQVPKHTRFSEFLRRLAGWPPAASQEQARQLVAETLTAVEDELSGVPNDPNSWQTDGRMYPPQDDSAVLDEELEHATRYRSRGHETIVADNGAIEIRDVRTDEIVFEKLGANGKGVWP